ncbi:thiamine pyrophosphate-dependent enzyme [Leadbetterella sp. DM7]|uniref:alpha-ketoacid dehydrogenase subunit alpha/beta n=1 Tax=Leadbetterella sp. DM7 TaxID=3235085 RepID=UPI00349F02B1
MSEILIENNTFRDIGLTTDEILRDYRLACESRVASVIGRKDVFMGKAKFGIFGDGKELAQIALAKVFKAGDYRSGYYRDQTLQAAIGGLTWQQFFAQMYAHANLDHDVHSGGRAMNGHFGNHWIDDNGNWLNLKEMKNSVMDVSSTAGQIPRSLGLAYASKLYRHLRELQGENPFSDRGNEVCYATIGDASTSQGMFFETINAAGVLQVPLVISVWDDGYGISVPIQYQTVKESISEALKGFEKEPGTNGIRIITVKGWDYPDLIRAYREAEILAREEHIPVLVHVEEITQQLGHSASGSHERYKPARRLQWELDFDCNPRFREWILENGISSEEELLRIEKEAEQFVKNERKKAWEEYRKEIDEHNGRVARFVQEHTAQVSGFPEMLEKIKKRLASGNSQTTRREGISALKMFIRIVEDRQVRQQGTALLEELEQVNRRKFNTHLYSETPYSPMNVSRVAPVYTEDSELVDGRTIINTYFDGLFAADPRVFAIGEDIGKIGDVNQGFAGLQEKYGELRITDTGIRETTIIGQGIGAAMRGLRPIVEIQYFDYIYYALATLTDDLASLRYRTVGKQRAPLIVRTRGHRLEGIWHSGSPVAVMLNSLRGLHVVVPRNYVKTAGFYNTLIKGDDPALIIESLNSYRVKELMPVNLTEVCEPLGVPEIIREGSDVTVVTYGSMCRIVEKAAEQLAQFGISVEVIDVQTLLPFDIHHMILDSVKKTGRVVFADEDMPGGCSAYMMQQVLEVQDAYHYLDSKPRAISAEAHRPAYGNDGDYYSKPNPETVFDVVYELMSEARPDRFPPF